MAKSFVLQALRIFGFEEMLKLSQPAIGKSVSMKKAAGAELIVWDDDTAQESPHAVKPDADILPFKKTASFSEESTPVADPNAVQKPSEESANFHSSDFMLWQRELSKENSAATKKDAARGYSRATEMYVVKTQTLEGKEKIRFAETNGVLVNKKQA